MENKKIAIIGVGNMGEAILAGLVKEEKFLDITINRRDAECGELLATKYGVTYNQDLHTCCQSADVVIFALKPDKILEIMKDIQTSLPSEAIIVSVAAGITLADMMAVLHPSRKVVRVMPNTPAAVGEAVTALVENDNVEAKDKELILNIFQTIGKVVELPEDKFHGLIGVAGSAPAYVYMFLEALADGAVAQGLPRELSYTLAAQTVLGSAKMLLETKKHPGELKDMVTSPGGTTIDAVAKLEEYNFRHAVIEAVKIAAEKSKKLTEK